MDKDNLTALQKEKEHLKRLCKNMVSRKTTHPHPSRKKHGTGILLKREGAKLICFLSF